MTMTNKQLLHQLRLLPARMERLEAAVGFATRAEQERVNEANYGRNPYDAPLEEPRTLRQIYEDDVQADRDKLKDTQNAIAKIVGLDGVPFDYDPQTLVDELKRWAADRELTAEYIRTAEMRITTLQHEKLQLQGKIETLIGQERALQKLLCDAVEALRRALSSENGNPTFESVSEGVVRLDNAVISLKRERDALRSELSNYREAYRRADLSDTRHRGG